MCEFCTKHGEGKKWYENMTNYTREVFLQVNSEEKLARFLLGFRESMKQGVIKAGKWKKRMPLFYDLLIYPWLTNRQKKNHFGQAPSHCRHPLDYETLFEYGSVKRNGDGEEDGSCLKYYTGVTAKLNVRKILDTTILSSFNLVGK